MRVLGLLLLAAAASGYEVGKEYVYKYKGTMHVFSPETHEQSSGMAFQSKVIVQPKPDHTHFKIVNFESDTFHEDHIDIEHHEFHYASNEQLNGALEHPFAAKFDEGKIEEIEMGKSEPLWVKNLKKGVLSLFQLDLVKGRHEHHDQKEYHVTEDSLHGQCDTLYIVHEEEHNYISVTKVKNHEKCEHGHYALFGQMKGDICEKCEGYVSHPHSASSEVYYDLEGTAQHYVIHHAWAEASHVFRPHGEGKVIHIALNRTLDLVEEHEATMETPLPEDSEKDHSLEQTYSVSDGLTDVEELKHPNPTITDYGIHSNKEKFAEALKSLAELEFTDDDIADIEHKPSGAAKFLTLFNSFSSFSYDEISDVYQNYVLTAPENIKGSMGHLFLDLLSAVGMNPHIMFGLNLIKNNEISESDADNFYTKVQLNLKEVSDPIIHAISDSCKSEAVKSHHEVWSTCKLAVSAVAGGKNCKGAKNDHEEDRGSCRPEIVSHFFNYSVTPSHTEHDKEYEITTYLRAAGNLATRKSIRYLEQFISPKSHAKEHHRMSALWALKQASKHHPELARSIALPVFHNTSEPSEIRIPAFLVVMFSNPDLYVLRHIALEIITEPSDQVVSFVTSAFRSVAKSKYPCHRQLAHHMRYVLPVWDHVLRLRKPVDQSSSHLEISSSYYPKYDFGRMTSSEVIRSRDSYMPRNMYFMLRVYRAGRSHEALTLSFESWGLDQLYNAFVGPHPGSSNNIWNFFGRRRLRREASAKELKEIETALPIADREYDPMYARLTLSMFGKTVDSWDIGDAMVELLKKINEEKDHPEKAAKKYLGEGQENKKHYYLSHDQTWVTATDMGVPVFFDFKQVDFFYAQFHNVDLTVNEKPEITLNLKRHYVYESQSYQMIGFAPQFTHKSMGTGYTSKNIISWPLDLQATLAPLEGKLKLHRPLQLPWNFAVHTFMPFTFVLPYDVNTDPTHAFATFANGVKFLYRPEELAPLDRHYFDDFLGISLRAKGHVIGRGLHAALREFYYKMTPSDRLHYLMINPAWNYRDVKLSLVPAAENPTKEVDFEISYKFLEPDDARESHFQVHDKIGDDAEVPSTHVLHMGFNLKGDTKERKLAAELRYSVNHDHFDHKVQFFYERTPFKKDEHEPVKICLDATAKFPKPDWTRTELATFYTGQHVDANLNLHYGSSCEGQTAITIDGKFTHTDEDEENLAAAAAGKEISRNRLSSTFLHELANKCKAGREKGIHFNMYCYRLLKYSSRFGKFTGDVEWHNFKPLLKALYPYYAKYFAYTAWRAGFLGMVRSYIEGENGKMHVVSQVPWWRPYEKPHTNMVITTADGHSHEHWEVPTYSHLLEPRVSTLGGYTNLVEYSYIYKQKTCDLQGHSVRTFDGQLVDLPETDCWKVVTRDCSTNKRFLILAHATNNPSVTKAVKVFIHKTKIEMLPLSADSGLVLRVDGARVSIDPATPYSHTEQDNELFKITRTSDKWLTLMSETYGVYVKFSGNLLFIQVAPFYRGKLCGLCGDYNLDRNHELSGPDGHLYNNTLEFAKSYVVPSPDCHPPAH
uniref:Putative vitellogenin-2 n=1 Tax=Amblyomma parvum TaxID=251391 RepID=A0A023FYX2_AMBPA